MMSSVIVMLLEGDLCTCLFQDRKDNSMRELRVQKLCLNVCVGESGDRLTRAA